MVMITLFTQFHSVNCFFFFFLAQLFNYTFPGANVEVSRSEAGVSMFNETINQGVPRPYSMSLQTETVLSEKYSLSYKGKSVR